MLNLFTIATDMYNQYIPFLVKSLENLKLDFRFILMSDKDIQYEGESEYIYYHIANLPYPFILYHKIDYIYDCINYNNIPLTDSFMFVDADTIFRKMPDVFWKNIDKMLSTDMLYFPRSPFYIDGIPEWENYNNKGNCCYIEDIDIKKYVQTSLFFGSIKQLEWLYNECYNLVTRMTKDDRRNPRVPYIFDQSIVNKLISIKENEKRFVIEDFIFNAYNVDVIHDSDFVNKTFNDISYKYKDVDYFINDHPQIFVLQKFNREIKDDKRL